MSDFHALCLDADLILLGFPLLGAALASLTRHSGFFDIPLTASLLSRLKRRLVLPWYTASFRCRLRMRQ